LAFCFSDQPRYCPEQVCCQRQENETLEKSSNSVSVADLRSEIGNCRVCADFLAARPRPVVQFSETSRIVIIGQAPGARVHASGVPWDDASGERLRQWTGLSDKDFYDPAKVALVPMGFCYPGTGESGDLPPRLECAPLWHKRVMECLPGNRLTLLVGSYAQKRYLSGLKRQTLTEIVRDAGSWTAGFFPLPHPSWRSTIWMRRNPWFEQETLPALRSALRNVCR
jgi:uracil-DNA glycosylase